MKPTDLKVLTITHHYWGMGDTLNEALNKMRKAGARDKKHYIAYIVHPDTRVSPMDGSLNYPIDFPPKEIHRVGIKEKGVKA